MKSLSFGSKLALILSFPLAVIAVLGAKGAWEKWRVYQNYSRLAQNSAVLQQIGRSVHELQRERGRSAGFLGSKGTTFAEELRTQRLATDLALLRLHEFTSTFDSARFGSAFAEKYQAGLRELGLLANRREAISELKLTGAESASYYTGAITKLLDIVVAMSHLSDDADIANGISCYVNFLQGKEQAGIERATLTAVFATDAFTPETFRRYSTVSAAQYTYFRVFESFASEEQRRNFTVTLANPVVDTVTRMRQRAEERASTGHFEISPKEWFDASTARIDLLKQIEDRLGSDYDHAASAIRQAAWQSFLLLSLVTALVLVITLASTGLVVRSLSRRLLAIADRLSMGATELTSTASQVSAASQTAASGVSEQAAALEETAAALEELSSMTKGNAAAAQDAKSISHRTRTAADSGSIDMEKLRGAMSAIHSSATNIASILKSIDEIAFQTNILALNAAVEAARAGEAGAGFAVVAEEVRALAQRSAQAARETAEKINVALQDSERGVTTAKDAAQHFSEIVQGSRAVDKLVGDIAASSSEQTQGIQQVTESTTQMDTVTQSNAAAAEEAAAQAQQLDAHARELGAVVGELMTLIGGRRANDHTGTQGSGRHGGRRQGDPALAAAPASTPVA